jgi:thiamine biosynthesis lipoprotein
VAPPIHLIARSPSRLRRARPLLGTLVDIRIEADDSELARRALAAAFAEIEIVHRLMSFHESGSDLARLNRAQPGDLVPVDARSAEVLRCAESLRFESAGAFDCAVADALLSTGLLPSMPEARDAGTNASSRRDATVTRGAARLDLGGIAKGYAVDRAIDVLKGFGVQSALVNAGGDLRHLGAEAVEIGLRDPADPSRLLGSIALHDRALASSASSGLAPATEARAKQRSALIDPRCGAPLAPSAGTSVTAPRCMIADALTKVVLVTRDIHHSMLSAHGATVVLYRAGGDASA